MSLLPVRWRRLVPRRKSATTAVLITAALTTLVVGLVSLANSQKPLIVMQLDTELLVQRVARPELSSLPVVGARLADAGTCDGILAAGRFTGVIRPPEGALLSYHWEPDRLLIGIEAPPSADGPGAAETVLSTRSEQQCRLSLARLQFEIAPIPTSSNPSWQLPIAGPAVAGSEFGAPLAPSGGGTRVYDLLRGGTISVYGKSIDRNMLFPIGNSVFEVPAGSRVASGHTLPVGKDEKGEAGPSWYGVALYDPDDGLKVSATTEAGSLLLFRPSPGSQPETFGIGLLASVLGDPATGMYAFAIGTFLAIASIVMSLMGFWRDPPSREPTPQRQGRGRANP
jgi:hypothetical protein